MAIVTPQIKLIIERANYHVNVSAGEFENTAPIDHVSHELTRP